MKSLVAKWASIAVFCGVTFAAVADTVRDPAQYFFYESFGDLREEAAAAGKNGQIALMLFFENDDCPWCKKMKATVLNQASVQDYFRKYFRIISIDTDGDTPVIDFDGKEMRQKDFALKVHRARATPTFMFLDLNGKLMTKYIGSTRNKEEFMMWGEFVVDGHYKSTNFQQFKRARREAAPKSS